MRYSRFRRKRTKQRYAAFLLIAVLLLGGIYVVVAGTAGRFISNLVSPILASFDRTGDRDKTPRPDEDDEPALTLPDKPRENSVKVTDTIQAVPLKMRAIQMGAFTEEQNAKDFGLELQGRGGAGYVIHDTHYRVMAMGFVSEEDAKTVRAQLKEDGIESALYEISAPGANMQITATEANVTAIKGAYAVWEESFVAMETIIRDLDSEKVTSTDAHRSVSETLSSFNQVRDELSVLSANQENNIILSGLLSLYEKGSRALSLVTLENPSNRIAISAKIKYTYIDMIMQYKQYMEQITK